MAKLLILTQKDLEVWIPLRKSFIQIIENQINLYKSAKITYNRVGKPIDSNEKVKEEMTRIRKDEKSLKLLLG